MAFALVGSVGAASQGAAAAAVTPAWGTSENRTAGNLLLCFCTVTGAATLPVTPPGWAIAAQVAGTSCSATIYWRIANGGEAAPTIAGITSGLIAAHLEEWSGSGVLVPDMEGTNVGTTSPRTATLSALNSVANALVAMAGADRRSTARASNDTWTSNHGTPTLRASNNGVSSTDHYSHATLASNSQAAADTAVMTLSITTSITGLAVAAVSFKEVSASDDYAEVVKSEPGLVGYWPLNETGGTSAADASGRGRTGTYTGSYTLGQGGLLPAEPTDKSVDLAPTTPGIVSIADHADFDWANGPFTLEAWVMLDTSAVDPGRTIISKGNGAPDMRLTDTPDSTIQLIRSHEAYLGDSGGGGLRVTGGDGVAHHVVITYAGANGNVFFYLDGAQHPNGATVSNFVSNALALEIGRDVDEAYFDGDVQHVAVYNRALTPERITAHYTAGVSGIKGRSTGVGTDAAAGTSHVVNAPAGIQSGDVLVCFIAWNGSPGTITKPTGWVDAGNASGQANPKLNAYYKVCDGTEGSTFTWTTTGSIYAGAICRRYTGVDTTTPMDATAVATDGVAATSFALTGITTVTDKAMLVVGTAANSSNRSITDNNQLTAEVAQQFVASAQKDVMLSEGGDRAAGATGTLAFNLGSSLAWAGVVVALRPASAGPPSGTAASSFGWSDSATGTSITNATGTAASSFGWSDSATGTEDIPGTGASTFGWSDSATGGETFTGTGASSFGWSTSATGDHTIPAVTGTAASAFGWSDSATGLHVENATGTAASAFGWSDSATGSEGIPGTAASSFGWSTGASGGETFSGTGASSFGWSPTATGGETFAGTAASSFGWSDSATGTHTPAGISGTAASAFGWSDSATGTQTIPPVTGTSASAFGWSVAGTGTSIQGVTGTAASSFGWGTEATGIFVPPAVDGVADSSFGWSTMAMGTHTEPYIATPPPWNTETRPITRSGQVDRF